MSNIFLNMEVYMKRIAFTGILTLIALFLVTCEMGQPGGEDTRPRYSNVVYSADMTKVTIYLDGTQVPSTQSQRAMTSDLAKMTYDYLEAVFDAGANGVARASWEIGQSAGISGVYRPTPLDYAWNTAGQKAAIYVGKKDRVLLGVGVLTEVIDTVGSTTSTSVATIGPNTTSLTFTITAIKTGLTAFNESATPPVTVPNLGIVNFVSFKFDTADDGVGGTPTTIPGYTTVNTGNSSRSSIGEGSSLSATSYPMYVLPELPGANTYATYTFGGAALDYSSLILHRGTNLNVIIWKREVRYLASGRYWYLKNILNTQTTVSLNAVAPYVIANNDPFKNEVKLQFVTGGSGIFSFNLEFPVRGLTDGATENGGGNPVNWVIRTGLGTEFYSVDDGLFSGGCVMMSIGKASLDWIDIYTNWSTTP
jgi:hypothetical protein